MGKYVRLLVSIGLAMSLAIGIAMGMNPRTAKAGGGTIDLVTKLKSSEQVMAIVDQDIHYMITVTNMGTITAPNVVISDHFPDPTSPIDFPECGNNGTSHWALDSNGLHAICEVGDLGAGQAVTMTVVSRPDETGQYVTLAEASPAWGEANQQDNAEAMILTIVSPTEDRPDMTVGANYNSYPNEIGKLITVEQHIKNLGPNAATNARMTTTMIYPVQGAYITTTWGNCYWFNVSAVQSPVPPANYNQLSCNFGGIAPWNEVTVTYAFTPRIAGTIYLTTDVGTNSPEISYENNRGINWITVDGDNWADLAIGYAWSNSLPIKATVGTTVTYWLEVFNADQYAPAKDVNIAHRIKAPLKNFTYEQPNGASCSTIRDSVTGDRILVCSLGTIPPAQDLYIPISFVPIASGAFTMTGSLISSTQDPYAANNEFASQFFVDPIKLFLPLVTR